MRVRVQLVILLTFLLASCGGGGASSATAAMNHTLGSAEPDSATVASTDHALRGSAVKGPLLHATIRVYRLDTHSALFFNDAAPIATGHTDAHAAITGLVIPVQEVAPLVLVVDGTRSTDITTGKTPVLTTLITLVTDAELRGEKAVYPTPLSTLAFHVARLRVGTGAAVASFVTAYREAAALITNAFAPLRSEGVDILTDPPLLTPSTVSVADQQRVMIHRAVLEGLASLTFAIATRRQESGYALTADAALERLAQDLAHDGVFDGSDGDTLLSDIDPALLGRALAEIELPNLPTRLDQTPQLLAQDLPFTGVNTALHTEQLRLDATQPLTANRTTTMAAQDQNSPRWTLRWNPNIDYIVGYKIYFGNSPETATTEIATVRRKQLTDPLDPSIDFNTAIDLKLTSGQRGCFRVKAYNEAGASEYSEAVCGVL